MNLFIGLGRESQQLRGRGITSGNLKWLLRTRQLTHFVSPGAKWLSTQEFCRLPKMIRGWRPFWVTRSPMPLRATVAKESAKVFWLNSGRLVSARLLGEEIPRRYKA